MAFLLILTVIEAAWILWLLWDRGRKLRAISERRLDIRILKRFLHSGRMWKDDSSKYKDAGTA